MTMTSCGGFALMVEGLSLAGMMELPIVILIAHPLSAGKWNEWMQGRQTAD